VGDSLAVKVAVAGYHVSGNPGAFGPGLGAQANNSGECPVSRNGEMLFVQGFTQAFGNVDFWRKQHASWVWGPPEDGLVVAEPGEDAALVGQYQAFGGKVAPYGQQAVGVVQGLNGVGEPELLFV
jgi:hypothetical protein